jgi:hypothetical protein
MPRTQSSNPFLKMHHLDLAYAVQRLVRLGTTTAAHVRALAAERKSAIAILEAKVANLKAALDVDATAPAKRKYTHRAPKQGRAPKLVTVAKRKVGRPKGSKNSAIAARPAKVAARPAPPVVAKILAYMKGHPGRRMEHISKAVGVPSRKLKYVVRRLAADKQIKVRGQTRGRTYAIA